MLLPKRKVEEYIDKVKEEELQLKKQLTEVNERLTKVKKLRYELESSLYN